MTCRDCSDFRSLDCDCTMLLLDYHPSNRQQQQGIDSMWAYSGNWKNGLGQSSKLSTDLDNDPVTPEH